MDDIQDNSFFHDYILKFKNLKWYIFKFEGKYIEYFNFALGEKKEIKYIKEMNESSSSTFNHINQESKYFKI